MAIPKHPAAPLAVGAIIILILSGTGSCGLRSWNDSGPDLEKGEHLNTQMVNGSVVLSPRPAHTDNWTLMDGPSSPSPRSSYSMAYDRNLKLGVFFGGWNGTFCNDTWTYEARTLRWTRMSPTRSPSPRDNAAMCFDNESGLFVLYGGTYNKTYLNDTWTYDARSNAWTERSPCPYPYYSGNTVPMAYDPTIHRAVTYGNGWNGTTIGTYDVTSDVWTGMACNSSPPYRSGSNMVYDAANKRIVLFGGENQEKLFGDTWVLDTANLTWTQRAPAVSPSRRMGHAMAYDGERGATLLYGGVGSWPAAEMWAYYLANDTWTDLGPSDFPSWRTEAAMYFDASLNITVLYGGWDGATGLGGTWLFGLPPSGTYTSVPKDLGGPACFGSLGWNFTTPVGTIVHLQLRSGRTRSEMENGAFSGPDGSYGSYFISSGETIPAIHNGSRWIQYRAFLVSVSNLTSPALSYVSIDYHLIHTITVTSPAGGENWTGVQNISWRAQDPDNDTLSFDLTLRNESGSILLAGNLTNESRQWSWNTSSVPDGRYRIHIEAADHDPSMPIVVTAISEQFWIANNGPPGQEPPPGTPPHCEITHPINGSRAFGTLIVRGTATNGSLPLNAVFVRVDDGNWTMAGGLGDWALEINISGMSRGAHHVEARAFDGGLYSENATVNIIVGRPDSKVTTDEFPFLIFGIVIMGVMAIGLYLWSRNRLHA